MTRGRCGRGHAACRLAAVAAALATAGSSTGVASVSEADSLPRELEQLWELVVTGPPEANLGGKRRPALGRACHLGSGASSSASAAATFLLQRDPSASSSQLPRVARLEASSAESSPAGTDDGASAYDVLVLSAEDFAGEAEGGERALARLLSRLAPEVVVLWLTPPCVGQASVAAPSGSVCGLLQNFWESTPLRKRGFCSPSACLGRAPASALADWRWRSPDEGARTSPATSGRLDRCSSFAAESPADSASALAAFAEGRRLARRSSASATGSRDEDPAGIVVNIAPASSGGSESSAAALLENCLGWRGVRLAWDLSAGRLEEDSSEQRSLLRRFADLLLLDLGGDGAELTALRALGDLGLLQVRLLAVRTTPGFRLLELETLLLPQGLAKVALFDRFAVYAPLQALPELRLAPTALRHSSRSSAPALLLPATWEALHQRVLDEEAAEEAKQQAVSGAGDDA
eukprot:TRINITY_DN27074_c0_g1_i1.p1 TRINITY_DN27074_c0_g1~~TRINITY_DN27074_c0_g1_i1.p1  ORF type:complete len:487 (-),score=118.03 TRINITY_DN27074_c0_g1_i1:209-1597(-)